MISSYENINRQRHRLGSVESYSTLGAGPATDLIAKLKGAGGGGGGDTATGIINALGRIGTNILRIVEQGKTQRTHIRRMYEFKIVETREGTKKLEIVKKAEVERARIAVEAAVAQYSGLTKIIIGGGAIGSVLMLSAAGGYYIVKMAGK